MSVHVLKWVISDIVGTRQMSNFWYSRHETNE